MGNSLCSCEGSESKAKLQHEVKMVINSYIHIVLLNFNYSLKYSHLLKANSTTDQFTFKDNDDIMANEKGIERARATVRTFDAHHLNKKFNNDMLLIKLIQLQRCVKGFLKGIANKKGGLSSTVNILYETNLSIMNKK